MSSFIRKFFFINKILKSNQSIVIFLFFLLVYYIFFVLCKCYCLTNNSSEFITKIAIISDLNEKYGAIYYSPEVSTAIKLLIDHEKPDLVLCAGDMIAAQKLSISEDQILSMWQAFDQNVLSPITNNNIAFAFTLGNHDASGYTHYAKDREIAKRFWLNKKDKLKINFLESSNFPFYYSFYINKILVLVLFANTSEISSPQLEWIKNQLENHTKDYKLKIMIGHLPIYPITLERRTSHDFIYNNQTFLKIFYEYNVDFYISGHQHAFYLSSVNNTYLLFAGAIGAAPRRLLGSKKNPLKIITILELDAINKLHKIRNYTISMNSYQIAKMNDLELPDKIWINKYTHIKRATLKE